MTDSDRFETSYRLYYARVWRYFRSCRLSDEEAHDMSQDVFKRLFERWHDVRGEDPWPFLQQIARSVLMNHIRAAKTQKRSGSIAEIDDPDLEIDVPDHRESPYADREEHERRAALARALRGLSKNQQAVLRLWMKGLGYEEIGATLQISFDAVKSRLRDAKRYLREQMNDKG